MNCNSVSVHVSVSEHEPPAMRRYAGGGEEIAQRGRAVSSTQVRKTGLSSQVVRMAMTETDRLFTWCMCLTV